MSLLFIKIVEILWEPTEQGKWLPKEYVWRDPRFFQLDPLSQTLRLRDEKKKEGVELQPYKFIQHIPKLKSGIALRGGLALIASWAYVFKSYALWGLVRFYRSLRNAS